MQVSSAAKTGRTASLALVAMRWAKERRRGLVEVASPQEEQRMGAFYTLL